jgi:hypothetical protein
MMQQQANEFAASVSCATNNACFYFHDLTLYISLMGDFNTSS